ncbi:la-related protein 6A isoform X1 [Abrus precatorius]|uniref:La-related protein 6A isoform X1 n=1 Tax=Abrus precatorius TaxID=3816 RepID=A0A8B8LX25_ABRPR|nr:la-related protein 6A isoform X1 [Abrus precatorius]
MEGGESVPLSATAASDTTGSPPPLDSPDLAVGSDDVAEPEIHPLISDEDHDHEHELEHEHEHDQDHEHEREHDHHDEDHDRDHAAVAGVSLDDLKLKIIKQVEYYFSDENLPTDKYLFGFIKRNKEGFVPISVIASFRKMKKLTRDHSFIVTALKESSLLVVSGDGKRVKRLNPFRFNENRDHKLYTVLVENLPEDHSKENIQQIFHEAGNIKRITINNPRSTAESVKHIKQEMLISSKLHALVEYETIEAAEKAVTMLNNEQDWRNGMRVKLLKRVGKYGHKKQAWKGSNSEKHSSSHVSEQTGDEDNHGSNEHHEDTHEEEDGEHLSKDKGGQRYRNQGRPRKHKYRAANGMGHGSTSSAHAAEASKPPPGPKMPDGTRGFAIGRGRPPVPGSN